MNVTMLLYPRLTQLDLTGPYEVLSRFPELTISLVWKTLDPVADPYGFRFLPTHTFETSPQADILFVPGGPGQVPLMEDEATLEFLRHQASSAQYITSVCTGSLLLAAAGLLTGRRATCHWTAVDQLSYFGVTPVRERVVVDGNRITGAGVTSGIDFALVLAAELFGEDRARRAQLGMEYDPQPPFPGGSPATSAPETVAALIEATRVGTAERDAVSRRAALRLAP
jgi:cyclohexyl-isocyanide hydratase